MSDSPPKARGGREPSASDETPTSAAPLRRTPRGPGAVKRPSAAAGRPATVPDPLDALERAYAAQTPREPHPALVALRLVGRIFGIVIGIWATLAVAERLLFAYPSNYPSFLLEDLPGYADVRDLRSRCGQPLEVSEFDGQALVRCGTIWPSASVWLVSAPRPSGAVALPGAPQ